MQSDREPPAHNAFKVWPTEPNALAGFPTVPALPVPGVPRAYVNDLNFDHHVRHKTADEALPDRAIAPLRLRSPDGGCLALMDKAKPHALLDAMIIQAGEEGVWSIPDLTGDERSLLLSLLSAFIGFIHKPSVLDEYAIHGSLPRLSFNYDPYTLDRPTLQSERRFHAHTYLIEQETIRNIRRNTLPLARVRPSQRNRLVDPATFIGARLLYDYIRCFLSLPRGVRMLKPDPQEQVESRAMLGLNFWIPRGWYILDVPDFCQFLVDLHQAVLSAASTVYWAYTDKASVAPTGTRHALLPVAEIHRRLSMVRWISGASTRDLRLFAETLGDLPVNLLRSAARHPNLAFQHVAANGPAFAVSMVPDRLLGEGSSSTGVTLNVSFRMFSDAGSAGAFGLPGIGAVLLARNEGNFSETDMERRQAFLSGLYQHCADEASSLAAG